MINVNKCGHFHSKSNKESDTKLCGTAGGISSRAKHSELDEDAFVD